MTTPEVPSAPAAMLTIEQVRLERMRVPIRGVTPLIMHNFSAKSRRQMLDGFQNKKSMKEPKNPTAEYEDAFYRIKGTDDYGFPSTAFKLATVGGARFYGSSVKMTELRQMMFFIGDGVDDRGTALTQIVGEPEMREDVVKLSMSKTDLRYRPIFHEWSATLDIKWVSSALTQSSVLSLISAGGLGVGIGEWRVEKKGDFGQFEVDETRTVELVP